MSSGTGTGPAFPLGAGTHGRGRTLTSAEIRVLNAVSLLAPSDGPFEDVWADDAPVALDDHLVLAVALSLAAADPLYHAVEQQGFRMVAALSHRAELRATVRGGDTLRAGTEIVAARASKSRPGQFVVDIRDHCTNQRGEAIVAIERTVLYRWDEPAEGAGPS